MLVLTRISGEVYPPKSVIRINDDIFVKVLGINGNQVKIGIEAPREVSIVRTEIDNKQPRDADTNFNTKDLRNEQ